MLKKLLEDIRLFCAYTKNPQCMNPSDLRHIVYVICKADELIGYEKKHINNSRQTFDMILYSKEL